jgi:hypothetical protein
MLVEGQRFANKVDPLVHTSARPREARRRRHVRGPALLCVRYSYSGATMPIRGDTGESAVRGSPYTSSCHAPIRIRHLSCNWELNMKQIKIEEITRGSSGGEWPSESPSNRAARLGQQSDNSGNGSKIANSVRTCEPQMTSTTYGCAPGPDVWCRLRSKLSAGSWIARIRPGGPRLGPSLPSYDSTDIGMRLWVSSALARQQQAAMLSS